MVSAKLPLYKDKKPEASKINPYNYRNVITNADGWMISTEALIDFPVEVFDHKFLLEPIVKDDAALAPSEKPIDDESVPNETESPHRPYLSNKSIKHHNGQNLLSADSGGCPDSIRTGDC